MISAERFARERASYWSQLLPRMDAFVRAVNISCARFSPPLAKEVAPNRRAFVAELAFELLQQGLASERDRTTEDGVTAAVDRVRSLIARLGQHAIEEIPPPTPIELAEAERLLGNLLEFVAERRPGEIEISPSIPGCGIVDRCAADILITRAGPRGGLPTRRLYEVKVVDRSFRAIDFRQLVTYAALMSADGRKPDSVGLVNPRRGVYFECPLDALSMDTAGVAASELLDRIVFELTAGEVSL